MSTFPAWTTVWNERAPVLRKSSCVMGTRNPREGQAAASVPKGFELVRVVSLFHCGLVESSEAQGPGTEISVAPSLGNTRVSRWVFWLLIQHSWGPIWLAWSSPDACDSTVREARPGLKLSKLGPQASAAAGPLHLLKSASHGACESF
jgi:hypothetical protein